MALTLVTEARWQQDWRKCFLTRLWVLKICYWKGLMIGKDGLVVVELMGFVLMWTKGLFISLICCLCISCALYLMLFLTILMTIFVVSSCRRLEWCQWVIGPVVEEIIVWLLPNSPLFYLRLQHTKWPDTYILLVNGFNGIVVGISVIYRVLMCRKMCVYGLFGHLRPWRVFSDLYHLDFSKLGQAW